MFGTYGKSSNAYHVVGVQSDIETSDPHQLIVLLFDGAISALAIAKGAIEVKDIPGKGKAISKAIDIIDNGLRASLNLDKGGDLADRLDALYEYMVYRLLAANIHNDLTIIDEISRLLAEIQSAWAAIRPGTAGETPAAKP